jgi:hypothetical protein
MMNSLIGAVPSAIRHLADATLFYFGSHTSDINQLPGKARFDIVYSPGETTDWEVVTYQWFEEKDGMAVLERRLLEPDETRYFEQLLAASNKRTGTQPLVASSASV